MCHVQAALPCTSVAILAESASSPLDKASCRFVAPEPIVAIDEKQNSKSSKPGGHKEKSARKRHGRLRQIAGSVFIHTLAVAPTYPCPFEDFSSVCDRQNCQYSGAVAAWQVSCGNPAADFGSGGKSWLGPLAETEY